MKKTGELLKEKREAASLSLSEVALATKINPKILTAIENGNEEALPSKTFLKGFLRAYAVFLKIDPEMVLRSYQEEMGGPPPAQVHEVNKTPTAPPASGPSGGRRAMGEENSAGLRTAAVVVIVLLIGVIIGVRELIEKYQREKQVESSAIKVSPIAQPPLVPETKVAAPETVAPDPSAAVATTSNASAPAAAAAPEVPPKAVKTDVIMSPPPAPPNLAVAPPESPPKEAETAAVDPVAEVDPEPAGGQKVVKNEIILEALDNVEVKFQLNGQPKKINLGPTQVHTIHTDQPLVLDISDGGAVNIIYNGRERGVPGDLGKPKQIKIP